MNQYEIRILRRTDNPLIVSSRFLGDFHAIRRAQAMAEENEGVEVWRGMTCLYRREVLPEDFGHAPNVRRRAPRAPRQQSGGVVGGQ